MAEGIHHDIEPGVEVRLATVADLDPSWRDGRRLARDGAAEHVLERDQTVAPLGQ